MDNDRKTTLCKSCGANFYYNKGEREPKLCSFCKEEGRVISVEKAKH